MDDHNVDGVDWQPMIDDSCDEALNQDPNSTPVRQIFAAPSLGFTTAFTIATVTAGTHQVSVVPGPTAPTTGARLTAGQGPASLDTTPDQQSLVFRSGTTVTDPHLAVGPMPP